jgi:hypothetical protein
LPTATSTAVSESTNALVAGVSAAPSGSGAGDLTILGASPTSVPGGAASGSGSGSSGSGGLPLPLLAGGALVLVAIGAGGALLLLRRPSAP